MFENRVMRKVFRLIWDVVTGEWRKLHNEELNGLYCAPNIVMDIKMRKMMSAGQVERMGKGTGVYRFMVGKPEGKGLLVRPRHI